MATVTFPTIAEAIHAASQRLADANGLSPRLDAEVLLRHVLGVNRTTLFMRFRDCLGATEVALFDQLIDQRLAGVPVAYLIREREFMGLSFYVAPGVLIPRPETELLVEWALRWLEHRPEAVVIDVGAGSGAIALSLATLLPPTWHGTLIAADISSGALEIARMNRDRLAAQHPAGFVRGDLAAWCRGPVKLLLANLPYLRADQVRDNPNLAAEPSLALLGGTDGLALISRLLDDAPRLLASGGAMVLEIDPSQAVVVAEQAQFVFPHAAVSVIRDLAGHDRHVVIELEH